MAFASLEESLLYLEQQGQLVRIQEEVDPHLEMAAIQLRLYAAGGPAVLFEKVKGSPFRAVANLFGTMDRCRLLFKDTIPAVQQLIRVKNNPAAALQAPLASLGLLTHAKNALPLKNPLQQPALFQEINIEDLPLIQHWPKDGGAFVTLPQVYSEDIDHPGIMKANTGMYRVQLSGNQYALNKEIGLHYQIHRGIGVHQSKANAKGQPLKVSVFVGGPPSHTLAAVMPLPEGLSEASFAGVLGGRRFRYTYKDGFCISTDADFVITGTIYPNEVKPEGPFGDHLGYYSLTHDFPVMHIHKVYARKNAIWPFTVVGRPPQEDTSFGALIHELTGEAIPAEVPGLQEVHAVDESGVHPLLLAIGSERYTPFSPTTQPAELLTIANHVLGTGQLSLAKFLYITAPQAGEKLSTHNIQDYLQYVFERIHLERDLHFHTHTTIDTLDYSGTGLNTGSKLVLAAYGKPVRKLCATVPDCLTTLEQFADPHWVMPGVIALQGSTWQNTDHAQLEMQSLEAQLSPFLADLQGVVQIIICDDAAFVGATLSNYLWVTYTRSNPSHDIHGVGAFTAFKHWGCEGPMLIDARIKTHHAPALVMDAAVAEKANRFFNGNGPLSKWA